MPITQPQIDAAQAVQHAAAHDPSAQVRLVAGPGSGKSAAIEERVCWLLANGVPANTIRAVSFTRASAHDLRGRIHRLAGERGYESAGDVRVTTLHSLALSLLHISGNLTAYPVRPLVLDDWEVKDIFDGEFSAESGHTPTRCEEIRQQHEAIWSTAEASPANYIPPDPAVSDAERAAFAAFHGPRTQVYACVLPGEIIHQCVERMVAGTMDAVVTLKLRHLIVDEFQDLNPMDLRFVDHLIRGGVTVFVAGDDDQSLYSFRFATPAGIQQFPATYPGTGQHELAACFRCPPQILAAAVAVIAANPSPARIPKQQHSLYAHAAPPVVGRVHRWRFATHAHEAVAVASSCRQLIVAGVRPREVLILLSNQRVLAGPLLAALTGEGVEAEHPRERGFVESKEGRLALALLRTVCDANDYVALRILLGQRRGVAAGTCNRLCQQLVAGNMNFRAAFIGPLPAGVFTGLAATALARARTSFAALVGWGGGDTIGQRSAAVAAMLTDHYDASAAVTWTTYTAPLPPDMTLVELRAFMSADTDEQQATLLSAVLERLALPVPEEGPLPQRVRVMTMHGAKGLSGQVVFIPGLEQPVLPGPRKQPYPGLVQEAARMLYVSLTRARAACVVSYAGKRFINGKMANHAASQFAVNLAGGFEYRTAGLAADETAAIKTDIDQL